VKHGAARSAGGEDSGQQTIVVLIEFARKVGVTVITVAGYEDDG
jgi:L-ribulose-5-phosphate 3-epimerase UlaE